MSRYLFDFDESVETWVTAQDARRVYRNYEVSSFGNVRNRRDQLALSLRYSKSGYPRVNLYCDGKMYTTEVHALVAHSFLTKPQGKVLVDHIEGLTVSLPNHVTNLRFLTPQENSLHRVCLPKSNKSGFIGVSYHKKRGLFEACIRDHGKCTYLGAFQRAEEAAIARDAYILGSPAVQLAMLNYPRELLLDCPDEQF